MDHVAIMRKNWGLIPKILDGRKKIESRWGKNKVAPWGRVKAGDNVYFKNSGEPITAVAKVSKVLEFENLKPRLIRKLLKKYGGEGGLAIRSLTKSFSWARGKRYCTLIFIKHPKTHEPFNIDKKGFGIGTAWLCVGKIDRVKLKIGN